MNEPSISIRNLLFSNWTSSSPGADSTNTTFNPSLVYFTTREWATNPQRIHSYQVSVISEAIKNIPEEVGALVMYRAEQEINVHVWAIVGVGSAFETVQQNAQNMMDMVDVILRVKSTADVGVGIQFLRISPGWAIQDDFDNRLVFHRVKQLTAVYYRTDTSIVPAPTTGLWGTAIWGSFNWG